MNLQNNTILITGGTGGFSLEFATKLPDPGNTLISGKNAERQRMVKHRLPKSSCLTDARDEQNKPKFMVAQAGKMGISYMYTK